MEHENIFRPRWPLRAVVVAAAFALVSPAQAVTVPGIDVSNHQGNINWTSVKNAGVQFAFVKATEGVDFVDARFHTNYQGAKAAGVLVGAYHFCRLDSFSTNPDDAINEANDFLDQILPYFRTGQYLPPVADVERFPPFANNTEARAFTSAWVTKFSDTIYNAIGVRPIIYQSLSKANTYYTSQVAASHELWLAWWKSQPSPLPTAADTPLWGPWQFWQWSDQWSVSGIAGAVDGDLFNGSTADLNKLLLGYDGKLAGDFNRDGMIDAADYVMWQKTMGKTVPIYSGADANGNARIDAGDLAFLKTNFGRPSGGGGGGLAAEIPEPGSILVVVIGACIAIGRGGRIGHRA